MGITFIVLSGKRIPIDNIAYYTGRVSDDGTKILLKQPAGAELVVTESPDAVDGKVIAAIHDSES